MSLNKVTVWDMESITFLKTIQKMRAKCPGFPKWLNRVEFNFINCNNYNVNLHPTLMKIKGNGVRLGGDTKYSTASLSS